LFENLLTEQVNPASEDIDALPTTRILEIVNAEDRKVADAVAREIPAIARAVDAIVAAIQRGGRLLYIGAGTSGRLGVLDASECPPTFSADAELVQGIMAGGEQALARATETTEDDPAIGARDLRERGFTARDVLVGSPPAVARRTCWARSLKPAAWAQSRRASVARPIRSWHAPCISPSRR
jgi:N-acetylmuramic acid 6-phosphate etherase